RGNTGEDAKGGRLVAGELTGDPQRRPVPAIAPDREQDEIEQKEREQQHAGPGQPRQLYGSQVATLEHGPVTGHRKRVRRRGSYIRRVRRAPGSTARPPWSAPRARR